MERVPTGYYCFLTFSHRFELAEEKEGFFLRIFNVFQKILLEKKCEEVGFIKEKAKEDPLGALAKCQLPPNYCLDLSSPLKDKAGFLEELKHACRLSPIDKEPLLKDAISKTEKDFPGVIALLSKAPKDFNVFYLLVIAHVLNEKSESAISLTGQALKELRIEGSIEAIRYYQHLLTYVPTYWQGYHKLASIMKTNPEKAHVLIKGSLEAIKAKEFVEARGFCDEAHKKYPDSFMDRWVDVLIAKEERKPDILTNREIQKILLSLLQAHPIPSDSASLIQLYEMLLHLGYSSHLCQEVVSWYFRQGDSKNGFRWLKELEQQGCGGSAKSDIVPIKGPKSAPQISKDLVTSVPKGATKELWSCLAAIYMAHGQVDDAEACYKECETFEMAMALAEAFYGLESFPKSAGYYYEALRLAGVDIGKIVRGVDGIKKIDPEMRQLSFQQQAQMRLWELLIKQREKIDDLNAQLERPRGYSSRLEISELPPICHILPKDWNICSELAPPPDMDPWLQGPCPFFGRKKEETRHRIFIPEGLTLERLLELAKSENIKVDISTLKHFEIKPTESSYWMTITSMSIPDSIGLTREVQKDALKEESFPRLIECLVLCILNRKTNPNVEYIRCEEVVDGDSVFVKANDQGILVIKLTIPMGTRAAHRF